MINRFVLSKAQPFPRVLRYDDVRSYVFTIVFALLNVATPWVFHQFRLAGPTFLPMHIFVLVAGLMFGWRFGLVVGVLSPLASYAVSRMPLPTLLPQIIIELAVYGLVAGLLRERFHLRMVWSLLGAIVAGRLALLLTALAISLFAGKVYSPFGVQSDALAMVSAVTKQGWPGIVVQLSLIPLAVWLLAKAVAKTAKGT